MMEELCTESGNGLEATKAVNGKPMTPSDIVNESDEAEHIYER